MNYDHARWSALHADAWSHFDAGSQRAVDHIVQLIAVAPLRYPARDLHSSHSSFGCGRSLAVLRCGEAHVRVLGGHRRSFTLRGLPKLETDRRHAKTRFGLTLGFLESDSPTVFKCLRAFFYAQIIRRRNALALACEDPRNQELGRLSVYGRARQQRTRRRSTLQMVPRPLDLPASLLHMRLRWFLGGVHRREQAPTPNSALMPKVAPR